MSIRSRLSLLCLIWMLTTVASLQAQSPKREMRATWIATVTRIDWPKESGATAQKNEMLKMLDSIQTLNMNTVFFQVRSRCDALYNSAFEPWSSDLGIARGTNPGYDPLAFVIEECHKRGLECHAWLNPYRYSRDGSGWTEANSNALNYEITHPEWLLWYTNNVVLDPALPEVRMRIKHVVGDILNKYDVDGIIFDDYFYPYGGTTNQDAASQATYKPAGMNVHDWRRDNVNRMIADVYDTIQAVRPWVTFGVSPFGIWTTDASVAAKEGITLPSGITGGNMYQEIYCDPLAWLKQGTVDYISPQLYWKTGGSQDYNKLCPWWADLANRFGVQFYSSMAIYKYAEKTDAAYTVPELAAQSNRNRLSAKDDAPGHVFYNTRGWVYDISFRNHFKTNVFFNYALTPAIGWKPANDQGMITFNPPMGSIISWLYNETTDSVRYAVYAVPIARINDPSVFSKSDYLLGVSYAKRYTLPNGVSTSSHRIAVAVLDRYGNEFAPRVLGALPSEMAKAQLIYPDDYAQVRIPVVFRWSAIDEIDNYVWQLATDANFTDIVCTRETTDNQFNTNVQLNIKEDGGTYYWRVRTRKANARDIWSETRRVILSSGGGS
ncbi:MAG: family 10 glycosylhydrolase, partial [Candidatus Symbiothrix sp.]|nr:family 10 glycosylhydrolase [Candidatus Symbiothrix sp.]